MEEVVHSEVTKKTSRKKEKKHTHLQMEEMVNHEVTRKKKIKRKKNTHRPANGGGG